MFNEREIQEGNAVLRIIEDLYVFSQSLDGDSDDPMDTLKDMLRQTFIQSVIRELSFMVQTRVREYFGLPTEYEPGQEIIGVTQYEAAGLTVPSILREGMIRAAEMVANGELNVEDLGRL